MYSNPTDLMIKEDSSEDSIHPDGLANDLIDTIMIEHTGRGVHHESSSLASSSSFPPEKCKSKVDHRLNYWKNMLMQRRALQERLRSQLGRTPEQMVLNHQGKIVSRSVRDFVEIVGLPSHSAAELLGRESPDEKKDCEYSSTVFPPNICNLEVVGRKYKDCRESMIDVPHLINTIRDTSTELIRSSGGGEGEVIQPIQTIQQTVIGPGVRINGIQYWPHVQEFSPIVDRTFISNPFQRHLRTIVRIENSGNQLLRFTWRQVNFFSNNDTLMEADSEDFVFDVAPFILLPGDFRDVTVLYQPRCVAIVKQRWMLLTRPRIFFCRPSGLILNLNGRCTPPKEYLDRLRLEQLQVMVYEPRIHLEQWKATLCPYERELEEREAFNRRNRSFQCRSHEDIDRLIAFYWRLRHLHPVSFPPSWDYSVHSLIHLVCKSQDSRQRIEHFSELSHLLDGLRGASSVPLSLMDSSQRLKDRSHTKQLYVQGILASRLEEWDEKVQLLRSRVTKGERKKYFMDSIYFLLYGLICSATEDIVSVIESTSQI